MSEPSCCTVEIYDVKHDLTFDLAKSPIGTGSQSNVAPSIMRICKETVKLFANGQLFEQTK